MTIIEFLYPLKNCPLRDICLAALYFSQRYENKNALTVEALRSFLKRGRIPKVNKLNLADVLAKSAPYVDTTGKEGNRFLWTLTPTGQMFVRTMLKLPIMEPEIENDVAGLKRLLKKISDKDAIDYIDEAINCLSINALRACVVFLWAGAVKVIKDTVIACGSNAINKVLSKYDSKARQIVRVDDLTYVKESTLILVAQDLGIYDKNERGILEDCLELRNKCGHPGKYRVGPKKVSSFIEDLVGIVFD